MLCNVIIVVLVLGTLLVIAQNSKNDKNIKNRENDLKKKLNELEGFTVTIEHDNGVVSKYSSLSKVNVKVGDTVTGNQQIGVAGTTVYDLEAGIHVHLELLQDGINLNPIDAIGKQTSELASVVK